MTKKLLLSLMLLASFASAYAMEAFEQAFLQAITPLNIVKQYLLDNDMVNQSLLENSSFGYKKPSNDDPTAIFSIISENGTDTIDITAVWPEIQNLLNNQS